MKVPFVDLTWQHQPLKIQFQEAIEKVIEQGDFILGQALRQLEMDFAKACGVDYGVGVASGTAAIALGLQACGLKPGDEVLIPTNTFVATVIGAIQAGVKPVLVDCQSENALIDLEAASKAVTQKTKGVIPVHLYGQMVSPQQLLDFAQSHNLIIFEDAAQSHLACKEGYTAGSVGIAAAFSFYPSKNLGAFGSGGMLVSNNEEIAQKMRTLRNYGAPSKYYHTEIGTNSRLDTIQAAILGVKLPYLHTWNQQRNQAAKYYDKLLAPLQEKGITPIKNESDNSHVYHLYVIKIEPFCPLTRLEIQSKLEEKGIQTGIHYPLPCHLQPAYTHLGYQRGDFPHAERLCEQILSLPIYAGLQPSQIEYVVEELSLICSL